MAIYEAQTLSACFGLQAEVDRSVAAANRVGLGGLSIEQLQQLVGRLRRMSERVEGACDARLAPPAR